jgi:hypothetical protein
MRRLAFLALFGATFFMAAPTAFAHEHRNVAAGKYTLTVGWGDEPAYAGFKNSAGIEIEDANHKPVTDGVDLRVEVGTGTQKVTLPIEAEFGTPGAYGASIIPTRPGTYLLHFTGTVKGDKIDETFTSSETTFDDIKSPADVQFPAKDPTTGDLAQKLDRDTARVTAQAAKAKDDASGARTVGMIGIVLGAVGVVVGGIALARKR